MATLSIGEKLEILSQSWEISTALDSVVERRTSSDIYRDMQLSQYMDAGVVHDRFVVKKSAGYSFLVWKKESGQPEVVLNITGVVMSAFFGPIVRTTNTKKILQNVSIVGFKNVAFGEALKATHQIYRLFEQSHPPGAMKPFKFSYELDEPAFLAQARFLMPAHNNPFNEVIHDIRIGQDPGGYLRQLVNSGEFCYTDDNEIEFEEVYCRTNVITELEDPCIIRPGYLVELSVNFRTVTVGGAGRPMQVFLEKLDKVVVLNKIGSRLLSIYDNNMKTAREVQKSEDEIFVSIPKKRRITSAV